MEIVIGVVFFVIGALFGWMACHAWLHGKLADQWNRIAERERGLADEYAKQSAQWDRIAESWKQVRDVYPGAK